MACTCTAVGFRDVVARALDELLPAEHPRTAAEQDTAFTDLRTHLLSARGNADPDARVSLIVVGGADPALMVDIDV